jgi:hypothetical protein
MQPILVPNRLQQIDEFGELDRKVKEFAPTAKRHEALAKTIRSWYEDYPTDEPAIAEGALYQIQVSERAEERSLGLKAKLKIYSLVGKSAFLTLVSLSLKAATTATSEETVDKLAAKERTGSRKLVPVLKAPAVKQAA